MRRILITLFSLFLVAGVLLAQNNKGSITGTVTDSVGALMPGVRIETQESVTIRFR